MMLPTAYTPASEVIASAKKIILN